MQPLIWMTHLLNAQRGGLFAWVPVCLAFGIGGYFSLTFEPVSVMWMWGGLAAACLLILSRFSGAAAPLVLGLMLVIVGAGLAKFRVETVAGPVLTFRYYGPIEGRVVKIDRSASDAVRLTLDHVVMSRMSNERTPHRVRVSLHGDQPMTRFMPGERLVMTGHLSPPSGPAEPGGFDFQRHAWFEGLGAVGYTRTPVLRSLDAQGDWRLWVFGVRQTLSLAVQNELQGETGAFAAAIMTGDRSGMSQETLGNLRASNLAHLLAISGLHMGLLTAFVFSVLRYGLALIPWVALRWPVKKIAASVAIAVGFFYLLLSGGNVATERAFIMVAVMFVAILLDRRALSLRAVSMAATLVLILQPESLVGPGFQMSFAATTALVFVFSQTGRFDTFRLPRPVQFALSVVMSSGIAGLATAPIAAAHFNQISHYGLIANVVSVPLMGVLVMPAAVLAVCLAPFGLWSVGLWIMEKGLRWILYVAQSVSSWDGALSHVVAPPPIVLALMTFGALFVVLWRGGLKSAGLVPFAAAFVLWMQVERPDLLVSDNGALLGQMGDEGRVLSRPKGNGFVASIWLENDGAPVAQEIAAQRRGLVTEGKVVTARLGPWKIAQVSGKTALAAMQDCGGADILISNQMDEAERPCLVIDVGVLRGTGAVAFSLQEGALIIETARGKSGNRPWNMHSDQLYLPEILTLDAKNGPLLRPASSRYAQHQ